MTPKDRLVSKLYSYSDTPCLAKDVINRCQSAIRFDGKNAEVDFQMKGSKGKGIMKRRRMFPSGPLGKVISTYGNNKLYMEFSAKEILRFLDAYEELRDAIQRYVIDKWGVSITKEQFPLFVNSVIDIEIEAEFSNKLFDNSRGSVITLCNDLIKIEKLAEEKGWRVMTEIKWGKRSLLSNYYRRMRR